MHRSVPCTVTVIVLLGACGADTGDVRIEGTPTVQSDATEQTGQDDAVTPPATAQTTGAAVPAGDSTAPPAGSVADGGSVPVTLQPAPEQPTPITVAPGVVDPALSGLTDAARADLAERLAVDAGSIDVVSAEAVVWPDRSLGCPQDGMAYAQVLVDGFRIVLTYDGAVFDYHGGGSRPIPFLCEQPAKAAPRPVPSEVAPPDLVPRATGENT